VQASRGRFDRRSNLDDFATVNGEGQVYIYSTMWQAYSQVARAERIVAVLAGNFTTAPGDAVAMFDREGNVFLSQNRNLENLGQKATILAIGRNPGGLDTLYAITPEGKIVRYNREARTWTTLLPGNVPGNALVFTNLIVTEGQTIYAVSSDNLYRISGGTVERLSSVQPKTVVLKQDGTPLARYRYVSVPFKPYVDELRTPSGRNVLRDAPWDYLHHHALMYALQVGGYSFWQENDPQRVGTQVTESVQSTDNSLVSVISWNTPGSRRLLTETRNISARRGDSVTLLDWETTLTAVEDTVVGGGHYYGLGMRFDATMDRGGRFFHNAGGESETFRNDERLTRCRWIAYTARLDGQPVTVAVFDHPSNPRPMLAFTMGDVSSAFAYLAAAMNLHRESVELKAGETFAVRYRIALWDGEVTPETVERVYADYVR